MVPLSYQLLDEGETPEEHLQPLHSHEGLASQLKSMVPRTAAVQVGQVLQLNISTTAAFVLAGGSIVAMANTLTVRFFKIRF